jgi:chromosomal replication initiator protein
MEHPAQDEPPPGESRPIGEEAALDGVWEHVQRVLRTAIRREQFETWFRRTALVDLTDDACTVAVHNGFTRDWLARYYLDVLTTTVAEVVGGERRIEFEVDPERTGGLRCDEDPATPAEEGEHGTLTPASAPNDPGAAAALAAGRPGSRLLDSSDVSLNISYRFDSFVVGPCNRFAHAACVGVGENPGRIYNPLFLHGSVGLGKTHLLQSLCRAILERDQGARILYLSCETFVNHFIGALENGDLAKFRTKYRNVDLLVVDDIHLLANKERTQEEFFHTFNTLYNAGKQIVLSSDSPPVDIPTLQERLVSRFKWGLVTEIEPPCYETRMAILKRKSRERGRELPDDVARFLAERIDTNIRELEGAVTKILGYASLSGQDVSLQLVRQCLRELFSTRTNQPSIEDIMGVVTERFGVKLADLQSRKRTNAIAYPRQIGMYLARRITNMSLEEIGGYFGGRDHSTVLHAVRKITRMGEDDPGCRALLAELGLELQGSNTV